MVTTDAGEPAFVGAQAIRTLTTLGWQNILRVARGETTIEGMRAYLVRDIRTYKRGAAFQERTEGELQAQFMDAAELEARLGINHRTLWRAIHDSRWDRIPQPEGFVSKKVAYWRREKVERWLASRTTSP